MACVCIFLLHLTASSEFWTPWRIVNVKIGQIEKRNGGYVLCIEDIDFYLLVQLVHFRFLMTAHCTSSNNSRLLGFFCTVNCSYYLMRCFSMDSYTPWPKRADHAVFSISVCFFFFLSAHFCWDNEMNRLHTQLLNFLVAVSSNYCLFVFSFYLWSFFISFFSPNVAYAICLEPPVASEEFFFLPDTMSSDTHSPAKSSYLPIILVNFCVRPVFM